MVSKKMKSELCKTCIHTKVCMKDKNLVGDVPVMGHPMFFDNDKLYEEYKERERQGFPCEDYISSARSEIIRCKDCKNSEHWYRDRRRCYLWSETGVSVFDSGFCNYAERRTDD